VEGRPTANIGTERRAGRWEDEVVIREGATRGRKKIMDRFPH
jgi:hypothetical protein